MKGAECNTHGPENRSSVGPSSEAVLRRFVRAPWPWALAVGAVPAVLAVLLLGRVHPDEVYQSLEPAFVRVHGYGVLAWEWRVGLRNWATPFAIAAVLEVCKWLGVAHPLWVRAAVGVPLWLLHATALVAAFRYGERRGDAGLWTLCAVGTLPIVLVFAGRTLGESLSASFLVLAVEALTRDPRQSGGARGGLALGLGVVVRYASGVAVAAALVWLVARGRRRTLGCCLLAGGAVGLGLAALDTWTWGAATHSVLAYLRFNVLEGGAASVFGHAPANFYAPFVSAEVPAWVWPGLLAGAFLCRPRVGLPTWMAFAGFAVLLWTPHKEERFLYPLIVLLALDAAPALLRALRSVRSPAVRAAVAGLALLATARATGTTVDIRGDEFRAIVAITRPDDARGLLIVGEGLWGAGGSFYVGKPIPWLTSDGPQDAAFQRAARDPRFNRAITFEGAALDALQAAGFRVTGTLGREKLLAR